MFWILLNSLSRPSGERRTYYVFWIHRTQIIPWIHEEPVILALLGQIHVCSGRKDSLAQDQRTPRHHLSISNSSNNTKAMHPMDLVMGVSPLHNRRRLRHLSCNNNTRLALSQICNSSKKQKMRVQSNSPL